MQGDAEMSFKDKISGVFSALGRGIQWLFGKATSSITGENVDTARKGFEALVEIGDEMQRLGEVGLEKTEDGELDPIDAAALIKEITELGIKVKKIL